MIPHLFQWHAIHEVEEALQKVRAHVSKLTNGKKTVGVKRVSQRAVAFTKHAGGGSVKAKAAAKAKSPVRSSAGKQLSFKV